MNVWCNLCVMAFEHVEPWRNNAKIERIAVLYDVFL